MILVDVEKATVRRPDRPLFENLSVTVRSGDRLGVVGRNGSGKSTLLRILAGAGEPEEGIVRRGRGVRVGYLDQEPVLPPGTVRDAVGPHWEAAAILEHLGMGPVAGDDVSTLSGGQTKRVALARVLVSEVDLLVLDEPTNHLDVEAIAWLEARLAAFRGGLVLVTHDRHVLDRAPRLEVVSSISVGVDKFEPPELQRRGIVLCHTPGVLTETVADLLFGMVLATSRRIPELARYVEAGNWTASIGDDLFGWDVHGKTLGILGYGRIGHALARRAALGFNMPVLYHSRSNVESGLPDGRAQAVSRDELLARITPTGDPADLAGCDAVIRATFHGTAGAVSIILVFALVVESVVGFIPNIGDDIQKWMPFTVASKFIFGDPDPSAIPEGAGPPAIGELSPWGSFGYFAAIALAVYIISLVVVKRRDA